jgi:putative transposase
MSPDHPGSLRPLLRDLHSASSREINRLDGTAGRHVWYEFWDKRLTFQRSYLTRLNYVHQNAVHHRLVAVASDYRWCSAAWFQSMATPAFVKTVSSFRADRLFASEDLAPIAVEE